MGTHLDKWTACIGDLEKQGFEKPLVPIVDREGGSVGHLRRWQSQGSDWLIRVKDNSRVDYNDQAMACQPVAQPLLFTKSRTITYRAKQPTSG